jgi:hypothetical protein
LGGNGYSVETEITLSELKIDPNSKDASLIRYMAKMAGDLIQTSFHTIEVDKKYIVTLERERDGIRASTIRINNQIREIKSRDARQILHVFSAGMVTPILNTGPSQDLSVNTRLKSSTLELTPAKKSSLSRRREGAGKNVVKASESWEDPHDERESSGGSYYSAGERIVTVAFQEDEACLSRSAEG